MDSLQATFRLSGGLLVWRKDLESLRELAERHGLEFDCETHRRPLSMALVVRVRGSLRSINAFREQMPHVTSSFPVGG